MVRCHPSPVQVAPAWHAFLVALPGLCALVLLVIGPLMLVAAISLTDWELGSPVVHFIGLRNYGELAHDPLAMIALRNTLTYTLVVVPVSTIVGLMVAMLLFDRWYGRVMRSLAFLPYMATLAAMALAWEALLHPTSGLVNLVLETLGFGPRNWLRDPGSAMAAIATIGIWQNVGLVVLLFTAALQSVPSELYDSANLDGVRGRMDTFLLVTYPHIRPTAAVIVLLLMVKALQMFDTVQVLTQGGPAGATEMILHKIYEEGFVFLRAGYSAALTIVFVMMALIVAALHGRQRGEAA